MSRTWCLGSHHLLDRSCILAATPGNSRHRSSRPHSPRLLRKRAKDETISTAGYSNAPDPPRRQQINNLAWPDANTYYPRRFRVLTTFSVRSLLAAYLSLLHERCFDLLTRQERFRPSFRPIVTTAIAQSVPSATPSFRLIYRHTSWTGTEQL